MSLRVRGYHLPGIGNDVAVDRRTFEGVHVDLARLTAAQLEEVLDAARSAANRARGRAVDEILATVDQVVANWLDPTYHLRRLANEVLPPTTGFSAAMVRHGLPTLIEPLRGAAIGALLDRELGDRRVLDAFWNGRRASGPQLMAHVISGNIPGLATAPILLSLAIKSATLIKSATGDLVLPALLAASIAEVDEALARCVVVVNWRGGDQALEGEVFKQADIVVGSGSDAAISAIAARVRGRFIGHGHKVSFAVIAGECLCTADAARRVARALAYDVSLWDQQGCLSPQLGYVESGGCVSPTDFSHFLAEALTEYARELPPRQLSFDEQAQVAGFRQEGEWREAAGDPVRVLLSPESLAWTVIVESDSAFAPTCLNRCFRLKVVDSLSVLPGALGAHRRYLEAAGVAASPERLRVLAEMLAGCGVHRVCPIGTLQRPSLAWQRSGRLRIADWVNWAQLEDT